MASVNIPAGLVATPSNVAVATTSNVQFNNVQVDGTLTSDDITSTNIAATGNLTVSGNLIVQGTTTTVSSATIEVKEKFVFEGATADAHETTLTAEDPTQDNTITIPDATMTAITTATHATKATHIARAIALG